MQVIFTGPKREALELRRILCEDGIDATVMAAADRPTSAVFVAAGDAESLAVRRALERVELERDADDDDDADEATPGRAPDGIYWRAFAAMRTAHARIQAYEEADPAFDPDDVEWAAAIGLDDINAVVEAVGAARGWRGTLEEAVEKAAALLMGIRAIALVLRNPLADSRREITAEDRDKLYNATAAIGYLLRLLDELASEGAAERWMREDARGPIWTRPNDEDEADEGGAAGARSSRTA